MSALGTHQAADPKPEKPQPTKANPAQALRQGKLEATTPALAFGQGNLKASPISEPWQGPTDLFQGKLFFFFSRSEVFEISPPNELRFPLG